MTDKPYERQRGETGPAWAAFLVFRGMDPKERTAKNAAKKIGKQLKMTQHWMSKYKWSSRVRAWDNACDKARRLGELRALEEMRHRQIQLALSLQKLGAEGVKKLLHDGAELTATEIIKCIEKGANLERLNRGEPSEIVQNQVTTDDIDYSEMSTDDIKKLKELRKKMLKK